MKELKKIAVLPNATAAELLKSTLVERGIPHVVKSYHDSALDGVFQSQKGWGHVEAPEEHRAEIEQILADLEQDPPSD